jgi:hypothetical protein
MIRFIFLAWAFLVIVCVLCYAVYDWITAASPAYKSAGNEDGYRKPRQGSNMRDVQEGVK